MHDLWQINAVIKDAGPLQLETNKKKERKEKKKGKKKIVPLNTVLDSQYAVGGAQRIERTHLKHTPKENLFLKFKELLFLVE